MRRSPALAPVLALAALGLALAACTGAHHATSAAAAPSASVEPSASSGIGGLATVRSSPARPAGRVIIPGVPNRTRAPADPAVLSSALAAARSVAASMAPSTGGGSSSGGASIAGCPLFPADNAWRQNISQAPVSPYSAAWVASIGANTFLHPDFGSNPSYGIPYVVVPANQPKVPITFTAYGDESDPGPYPVPLNAPVEAGGDAHVLVASANCHLYELYGAARTANGWSAQSGAVFNLESDALRPAGWTSADAAGLPILPGLVRYDEVTAGQIDHALRFTVSRTQDGYISPATHEAGSTTSPNVPPMGARFRLKASFDISHFTGEARVILQALKTYGMIVADNGSNWYLSGATNPNWNDDDLDQLKTVPGSAFEAVNTGPVHTGS